MADEHNPEKPAEAPAGEHVHGEHCAHGEHGHGEHVHGEHCSHGEHGHSAHAAPAPAPFSNSEITAMHSEDRKAAANIVLLMVAIFVSGIILYSVVDYIVSQGWY